MNPTLAQASRRQQSAKSGLSSAAYNARKQPLAILYAFAELQKNNFRALSKSGFAKRLRV
jgi:hypothetical protein